MFRAYKVLIARPIDARDPGTVVNIPLRLQSGETMAQFSYPDFEAYRDGLRAFSGVIAFSIEQLALSHPAGVVRQRPSDSGTLLRRLGLVPPATANTEIATTFVVSENYFAVLGVAPARGRAFDAMTQAELAAAPAVLISGTIGTTVSLATRTSSEGRFASTAQPSPSPASPPRTSREPAIALVASWLPSRRAMRIDPLVALREQ